MSILVPTAGGGGAGGGAGDVEGPASSTDNSVARYDSTTGKLLQNSDLVVADVAANIVDVSATTGNGLQVTGSDASGGDIILRSTSHATKGVICLEGDTSSFPGLKRRPTGSTTHVEVCAADYSVRTALWAQAFYAEQAASDYAPASVLDGNGPACASGIQVRWSSNANDATQAKDLGFARNAAGVARVTDGSTGVSSILSRVLVEASTAGSGAPNVLTATESRTALTNEGSTAANYQTLPTASAGLSFEFVVQDADGMRIVAGADDTIRVLDKVTAAAGYLESTTIGSVVRLLAINAVEWIAMSIHGVWTDGTFTYDDTGNTSP